MGCSSSAAAARGSGLNETAINKKIQREQGAAQRDAQNTVKLLLLGAGDSGKTTLRKQFRNLYGEGFNEAARKQVASVVLGNLIDGVNEVVRALPNVGGALSTPEAAADAEKIASVTSYPSALSEELAGQLRSVITDSGFQAALASKRQYQLQDCWATFSNEFLTNYPKWGGEGWVPSVDDCVSVRVRTSGIVEEAFEIDGIKFNIFDVGGQRAERRKWIHSFDNVTAVIFVTAISEYDQVLFEDRSKNRLEEALELFEEICNSRWFIRTPMLLFLNKKDLFEKKFLVDKVPLNISGKFPTAPEGNEDAKKAIEWIQAQFLKRRKFQDKDIYTFQCSAVESNVVRAVFDSARAIILKQSLAGSGFVLDGPGPSPRANKGY